ncbi:polysaccharide deacetylase family protein [Neobacillus mesonae]|uniref:NodB homology domain-containing protein n=1 Tax=Neobacillus mesonae TaxID=1193713 RepID=A0A3Q9QTK0_9BACI|nr:polysaccharide deacetylase family protein [Neobacillus mesonae]AZU61064.1 hypothetical protein CHR53_07250 [Neobacillus mesonae]
MDVKSYGLAKKYTDQEVTKIINESTPLDAMARQAATDAKGVDKANLKKRLDDDYNELTTQLTQKATEIKNTALLSLKSNIADTGMVSIAPKQTKRPLVTFIDDDGYSEVMTRLKPLFDRKGIKGTLAIVSDWVGKAGNLSQSEILQLQNEGWEIASHEKTHIAMGSITDEAIINREIVQSKEELLGMGFNVKNIVYPFGQTSAKLLEYVKKVYRSGTITNIPANDSTVTTPLDTYLVRRVDFSASTLAHYKSVVDKAVSESSWVIFMTHIKVQTLEHDQILSDLIDYIKSLNVEIVTFDKGLDTFGDKLSIDGFMRVTPDNRLISSILVPYYKTATNAVTNDTPMTSFENGAITVTQITSGGAASFPEATAGTLTTDKSFSDAGYQKQIYSLYNTSRKYERYWMLSGSWSQWVKVQQRYEFELKYDLGTVNAQSSLDYNITVPGANVFDQVVITTSGALPDGLIPTARVSATDTVTLRMFNIKSTNVRVYETTYRMALLKR